VIYDTPKQEDLIRQGDIFCGLPRIDIALSSLDVIDKDFNVQQRSWMEIAQANEHVTAVVGLRPVTAIVITQNCDALRTRDISLCEIRSFRDVEGKAKDTKTVGGWVSIITQQARLNLKWFYLPPDDRLGFNCQMAVDMFTTLRVSRADLEQHRSLRKGRLNSEAEAHFRERIADFFRRYAYNEWYALSREEYLHYSVKYPDAQPYSWQR